MTFYCSDLFTMYKNAESYYKPKTNVNQFYLNIKNVKPKNKTISWIASKKKKNPG